MVSARGAVKIADFGIALSAQDFSKKLTSTGEFVGTPGYLSPEVCQGKPVDQRSDIFSLGIVLFECLAGRMPFTDESPLGLMLEVVKAEIPNVMSLNAEVDPELSRILTKMVAKDPNERYQSCHELVDDLGRHPLVAKGGPITLQTKMSPAAATMVGQKTPISGQQPLPRTSPTPRPAVIPIPSAHQSVLQAQPAAKAKSGAVLPLAIAAILLLACAGGAYAFRDRIPFLQQYMGSAATASTTTTTSAPATAATTTATTAPSSAPAVAATTALPVTPPTPPTQDTNAAAQTASVQAAQQATDASTAIAQQPPAAQPVGANSGGPAARASEVEPLRELPAAQAAESRPQQVARITPPPPPVAPRPHIPTVAVIGGGDNNVAEPAERMIEQALSRRGYNVMDEASMPRVAHLFAGERPRYDEALNILAKLGRVDAVVIVHARDVGAEQLAAYGQVSNVVTAQLRIKIYSVDQHHPIGNDWSDAVHFSSLNAADQTNETVRPWLNEIAESLKAFHPHRDRG